MRRFHLIRNVDPLGISGTGTVAEGIEFRDGAVVLCWISGPVSSLSVYRSMADCRHITCDTRQDSEIHYLDPAQ